MALAFIRIGVRVPRLYAEEGRHDAVSLSKSPMPLLSQSRLVSEER